MIGRGILFGEKIPNHIEGDKPRFSSTNVGTLGYKGERDLLFTPISVKSPPLI